ncbi:MAG: ferritin [Candidatus Altiarchaeales archaeon]|nr:ferritin [Candidatus Altiarchaeales archaeon]
MGTKGKEIVEADVEEIVALMNKALADEWLAYYQYWVGAKVVTGPMRGFVEGELMEHAGEELKHANMLVERILQLDGTPLLSPDQWIEQTNCGYDAPEDPQVKTILKQNIKGEQCAIEVYNKLVKKTRDTDPITYRIVLEILEDEVEHEDDLQQILEDLEGIKKQI